ncbi:MAG: hemolysin family protein [Anaerolineales bacterium]|nr:hemolysin family protein [Anaerolineales bacterium]
MTLWVGLLLLHLANLLVLATQTVFGNPFRAWDAVAEATEENANKGAAKREARVEALQIGLATLRGLLWLGLGGTLYLLLYHQVVPPILHWQATFSVLLFALVILNEWIVQAAIHVHSEEWEKRLQPIARLVAMLFSPILSPILKGVAQFLPVPEPPSSQEMAEELMEWVNAAQEQGEIESEHGRLIHSIFELSDTLAREIMVPRVDIVAVEKEMNLNEAAQVFIASGHSRLPLYEETIDQIRGIIYAKDLLRLWVEGREDVPLTRLARPAYFIPEAKRIDELLNEMQQRRVHLAIVVDEYGGVAGLVTLEDIIEEILGEIQDEYDQAEELPYQEIGAGEVLFQGKIDLGDFNEIMHTDFPKEEADTLGGFILQQLGRVPTVGEKLCFDGVELIVEQVSGRRIRKVRARRLAGECDLEDQNADE